MEQTDSCQREGGRGTDWKKVKDQPKNIHAQSTDTDNSVVVARGKGGETWVEVGKEGEMRTSVIVSIIQIK